MDPITAIATGAGSLFGFLDSVIYTPQEVERDALNREQLALGRDQLTFQQTALQTQAALKTQTLKTALLVASILATGGLAAAIIVKG